MVETRTAGQSKDADLYVGLSDECHQSMNSEAARVSQVNRRGSLLLLENNAHR